jgi:hypothetical protein
MHSSKQITQMKCTAMQSYPSPACMMMMIAIVVFPQKQTNSPGASCSSRKAHLISPHLIPKQMNQSSSQNRLPEKKFSSRARARRIPVSFCSRTMREVFSLYRSCQISMIRGKKKKKPGYPKTNKQESKAPELKRARPESKRTAQSKKERRSGHGRHQITS